MTDPALEALWKKVVDDWSNDATHGAFLEYCESTNQLLEAAVRYRGMKGDHVRGPVAEKRLAAIALLAVAGLERERSEPIPARKNVALWIVVVFFLAASLALLTALGKR